MGNFCFILLALVIQRFSRPRKTLYYILRTISIVKYFIPVI